MDEVQQVAVYASPEIEAVLVDNRVGIFDLLEREGLDITEGMSNTDVPSDPGLKEPVTIILASAAVIAALTPILTRTIAALSRKQVVATERVLVPVETSHGDLVRDKDGRPILHWVNKSRLIESSTRSSDKASLTAKVPTGLMLTFETASDV